MWLPETAAAALDDLAAGCAVSIGPVFDGALYLLALAEPIPELLALGERPWHGVQAMAACSASSRGGSWRSGCCGPSAACAGRATCVHCVPTR